MKIDQVVASLERQLTPDLVRMRSGSADGRCEMFSQRHAEEVHVFGVTIDVAQPASDFGILVLRVAITSTHAESIKGEVIWFRTRKEYGRTELSVAVKGFTPESVLEFTREWPRLLSAVEDALARRTPLPVT